MADAAYRQKINIPLDCRDGACGTCKCHCESGELRDGRVHRRRARRRRGRQGLRAHLPDAAEVRLRDSRAGVGRLVQDRSRHRMAASSRTSRAIRATTVTFSLQAERPLSFLPGQYVKLQVPGSKETRSYSFSSAPNQTELSFLIRDVPNGLMSTFMRSKANTGDFMMFAGPYGSFYLRPTIRPILMLAGGTGLAPFLSMLLWIKDNPTDQPITLAYGVNTNDDLVELGHSGRTEVGDAELRFLHRHGGP